MRSRGSPRKNDAGSSSAFCGPVASVSEATPVTDTGRARMTIEGVVEGRAGGALDGNSDVFVVRRSSPELTPRSAIEDGVTLFVHGWENVAPGPLSWAFPDVHAALLAVRTMRNAIAWCIASGREPSVDAARAKGAILYEQDA